jgi:gas vesicle protein
MSSCAGKAHENVTAKTVTIEEGKAMIGTFIVGAIAGGVAAWFWRDEIGRYVDRARARTADSLNAVEKKTEDVIDRAKPQIVSTLRAGRDAIRPSSSTDSAGAGGRYGRAESAAGFGDEGPERTRDRH